MLKKWMTLGLCLLLPLMLLGCGEGPLADDPNPPPQNGETDQDPPSSEDPQEEEPHEETPPNLEDLLPSDPLGTRVLIDSLDALEVKEHVITIDEAGVYEIYSGATFDATGILYTHDKERLKGDYRTDDFIITLYLQPAQYIIEVRGSTRDEFGAYGVHVEYREDLAHVHYYVLDKVRLSSVMEHVFEITEAGNYSVIGESVVNIQGTLYNKTTGNYLTTDWDSHVDGGFKIDYDFEPGTYEIHIRGYDWSAADYEVLIIKND